MEIQYLAYSAYVIILFALVGLIFAAPFLAFSQDVEWLYHAFGPLCHQKLSRSYCLFNDDMGYWLGDCSPQEGSYITSAADRETIEVRYDSVRGFKMPVCARDLGLYGAMLLAALIYPLVRRLDERTVYPAIYLMLGIVPLALDGGVQLISELGILPFVYESTNLIRLLTGGIAGFVATFYALPLIAGFAMAAKNQKGSSGPGPQQPSEPGRQG